MVTNIGGTIVDLTKLLKVIIPGVIIVGTVGALFYIYRTAREAPIIQKLK